MVWYVRSTYISHMPCHAEGAAIARERFITGMYVGRYCIVRWMGE